MFSSVFVCFWPDLCWALGLSVCLLGHLFLKWLCYLEQAQLINVFAIFGSPEKDWLLVLKMTGYCSSSYILPSCQATAPSLLR